MKNISVTVYIICIVLMGALIFSWGVFLFRNHGGEALVGSKTNQSASVGSSDHSTSTDSGVSTSVIQNSGSHSTSESSGAGQDPVPDYITQEYVFTLSDGDNPLERYEGRYTIVIPVMDYNESLPNEGYKTYIVSENETVDDYLGDVAPLLYYEIKYEYGGDYFAKIVLIPKSAFTLLQSQLFVANALPEELFNDNFYENVYSDGAFKSIKIISRDLAFSISDYWNT